MKQQLNNEIKTGINLSFTEFKLSDNKSSYYLKLEDINYHLQASNTKITKAIKQIKRTYGQSHVILYKNKYYVSQFGFEQLIQKNHFMKYKRLRRLILGKYRNKNNKLSNPYQYINKGLTPMASDNMIFRVINNLMYISTHSIANKLNISIVDLNTKCKKECFFDKESVKEFTMDKKKNVTSYLLSKSAYDKLVNIYNEDIDSLYNKSI